MSRINNYETIADKYKMGGEFHDRIYHESVEKSTIGTEDGNNKKNYRKFSVIIVISSVLFLSVLLAGIKNPSQTESKAQINAYIVERFNDSLNQKKMPKDNKSNGFINDVARVIFSTFAPSIVNSFVDVKTSDYIIFSTFDAKVINDEDEKTLMSGIILYGKIIPLQTDLDKNELKKSGFDF